MMANLINKRNMTLALTLVITLMLAWQTHQQKNSDVVMSVVQETTRQLTLPSKHLHQAGAFENYTLVARLPATTKPMDLFAAPPKNRANVKVANTEKSLPQVAPPIPFEFVGLVQEQEVTKVAFDYLGSVTVLKLGEVLANYQLVEIKRLPDGLQIKLLYLPIKTTQIMVVNNANE